MSAVDTTRSATGGLLGSVEQTEQAIRTLFGDPNRIFRLVPSFFEFIKSYLETSGLTIPLSDVFGQGLSAIRFERYTTTSIVFGHTYSFIDGPIMYAIPDGQWLFLYGAMLEGKPAESDAMYMSLNINSVDLGDTYAAVQQSEYISTNVGAAVQSLNNGGNSFAYHVYRTLSSSSSGLRCNNRWLAAIRIAAA